MFSINGGNTWFFFIKTDDQITGPDAIYYHYKGFIPISGHCPFTTRPGLASIWWSDRIPDRVSGSILWWTGGQIKVTLSDCDDITTFDGTGYVKSRPLAISPRLSISRHYPFTTRPGLASIWCSWSRCSRMNLMRVAVQSTPGSAATFFLLFVVSWDGSHRYNLGENL
jgi:hypothetical protein